MEIGGKRIDKPGLQPGVDTRLPSKDQPFRVTTPGAQPQQRIRALVHTVTSVAIVTDTVTKVDFTTGSFDSAGIWNGNSRFTIPTTGKVTWAWELFGQVKWAGSTAGTFRKLHIRKNGSTIIASAVMQPVANPQTQAIKFMVNDPSRSDYYELCVEHDAGVNVNISGTSAEAFYGTIHLW